MTRISIYSSIILILLSFIISCAKQKERSLVGEWQQVEPECEVCQTYVFDSDNYFYQSNSPASKLKYEVITKDSVFIEEFWGVGGNRYFEFSKNKETLLIEGFIIAIVGIEGDKDILLKRID